MTGSANSSLNYPSYQTEATTSLLLPPAVMSPIDSPNTFVCNPFLAKSHLPSVASSNSRNPFEKNERKPNAMEKKFNSLKAIGTRKTPQFYSMRLNKCKRHQSLPKEPQKLLLINSKHKTGPPLGKSQQQPLFEHLTDSIQIHELDELQGERERSSIYRSDSGISNSSYECVTPVPAPRTNPRSCQSAPVYMNLPSSTTYASANGGSYQGKRRYHISSKYLGGKCSNGINIVGINSSNNNNNNNNNGVQSASITPNNGSLLSYEVCLFTS